MVEKVMDESYFSLYGTSVRYTTGTPTLADPVNELLRHFRQDSLGVDCCPYDSVLCCAESGRCTPHHFFVGMSVSVRVRVRQSGIDGRRDFLMR